jgi:uncharacterized SAM-binding protein YcdF (DUF218 family)
MVKKRKSATELPSFQETESIIDIEGVRAPIDSKVDVHYPDFEFVAKWLRKAELDSSLFLTIEDPQKVLSLAEKVKNGLARWTLDSWKNEQNLLKDITKYLGESERPHKSNLILVFGSSKLIRIEKGIELWRKGISPKIMVTGNNPFYKERKVPEAIVYSDYAVKHGIPEDCVLVEDKSVSIPDNIKRSLNLLDEMGFDYLSKGITTVSSWFANRRIWCHLMKLSPEGLKIYRTSPKSASKELGRDTWYKNEKGIAIIFNEFVKMRMGMLINNSA